MLAGLLCTFVAIASDLEKYFPKTPLPQDQMLARSAQVIGPPARVYDAVTATPTMPTALERAVEALVLPKTLTAAPDSLRCWGRYMLTMNALGPVPYNLSSFAGEHCGLPLAPEVLYTFVTANEADRVAALLKELKTDDEALQAVAVVTEPIENGVRGIVVAMYGAARFQPFPRVWQVGDVASVPGTPMLKKVSYALYVAGPGAEAEAYALPANDGVFDIDIPLSGTPGAWRVAMNAAKKDHFADSSFFFTLYVGEEPPLAPPALPAAPPGVEGEAAVLALLNAERARQNLAPLEPVGDPSEINRVLTSLPKGEVARVRAMRQWGAADPVPDTPHGTWGGLSSQSGNAAEAAWIMATHPVNREDLMDPLARYILLGSASMGGYSDYMGILLHGPPTVEDVRSQTAASLAARFHKPPTRGPNFEAQLDAIAQRVADGSLPLKGALKATGKAIDDARRDTTVGGAATINIYTFEPTTPIDLSALTPAAGAKAAAVGIATGTLGDKGGIVYAVALVVTAESMR